MGRKPVSGGFAFEPRTLVLQPRSFGRVSSPIEPADDVDRSDPRYAAALLQHLVANKIREGLHRREMSVEAFTSAITDHLDGADVSGGLGVTYDRVIRLKRGETMMQLADLLLWARLMPEVGEMLANERFGWRDTPDAPQAGNGAPPL